uniref:homeobox-leucine zipper protein HDG12-like n=1 Tax=Erigeron canadensis TaxID=72917 RepID=UPI001CB8C8DD|nr:homeobox-leucine zipper protein HDG12-like [Erigeron canadensis]XP_043606230.1 homeobox-leucine zipper protein HDG12-like [Erigeron canadensis]
MRAKLQAPTLYVPKRAFCFLRTFKEIDPLTWVVADMSIDSSRNIGYPCGCLIRGLANGYSQVIWVEHLTFEESYMDHKLYTDLSRRGFAFGAQRWVDCLEQSCERRSYQTKTGFLVPCLVAGQEDPCQDEKKCVMELTQKMVHEFCSHIHPTNVEGDPAPLISCVPALRNMQICVSLTQSPYDDDPKEMVLISVTTFSLLHSPEFILEILGDEDRRHEWDVSGKICPLQKPTCYTTGIDSRNKISLYQTCSWFGDQVVLQEASVNQSGSLLVWSVLKRKDFAAIDECIPRLPVSELSGLAISSNSHPNTTSSSNTGGGSIVTLAVHQVARDIKELEQQTINFAKKHIRKVALSVEAVLNESAKRTSPEEVCGVCGSSRLLQQTNKRLKQYS